jgi:hypothetical protein
MSSTWKTNQSEKNKNDSMLKFNVINDIVKRNMSTNCCFIMKSKVEPLNWLVSNKLCLVLFEVQNWSNKFF